MLAEENEDTSEEEKTCPVILKSGKRVGQPCGRKAKYDDGKCGNHHKKVTDAICSVGTSDKRKVKVVELKSKVYVCGVTGSSKDTGNWKTFWEKHTDKKYPKTCRAKDCEKNATDTGHLYLRDDKDKTFNYLVPICSHHNSSKYDKTPFLLKKTAVAVKIYENKNIHK